MIPNHRTDVDEFLLNLQNVADYQEADWKTALLDRCKHKVCDENGRNISVWAPTASF